MSEKSKSDQPNESPSSETNASENFEEAWNRIEKKVYEEYKIKEDSSQDIRDKLKNRGFTP
jgi:hypothetical protein